MDQFGLHAREATYNEVDVIMKLKEDLYYIDIYEEIKCSKYLVRLGESSRSLFV